MRVLRKTLRYVDDNQAEIGRGEDMYGDWLVVNKGKKSAHKAKKREIIMRAIMHEGF